MNSVLAWHFAGTRMRDGSRLGAPGEIEIHDGPMVMCERGLHASERLMDALTYAPGPLLRRVRLSGEVLRDNDKMVAECREVLWECDMEAALRLFARKCALDVAHLWPMPPLVREYLMTGREDIRHAAMAAAGDAARAAARAAARDAARAAARAAARDAARAAARDAARAAARAAAGDVAGAAARDAARAAAMAAAGDVARAAARDAARAAQERRLVAYAQAARAGIFR